MQMPAQEILFRPAKPYVAELLFAEVPLMLSNGVLQEIRRPLIQFFQFLTNHPEHPHFEWSSEPSL